MERTDLQRMERKVAGERTIWRQAPSGAQYGFTDETGSGGRYLLPAAASWDDRPPDPAALEKARQAGRAALAEGYGPPVRTDGRVPCLHCAICDAGAFDRCRQAKSRAEAQLHAAQAHDADRTRDQVVLAELEALTVELADLLG